MNNDLNNIPYAKWLENALQELIKIPVEGICITALTSNGEAYTNYYNVSMMGKLTIAGLIQQDATFDSLAANGVIDYEEDEEEENGDDG